MSKLEEIRKHLEDGWTDFEPEQVKHLLDLVDKLSSSSESRVLNPEHSNLHYGKDEFVGIDGYGPYSLRKICKDRWEIVLGKEKIVLYNRRGRRIRGDFSSAEKGWDGDW